jgi:hypothetical protein
MLDAPRLLLDVARDPLKLPPPLPLPPPKALRLPAPLLRDMS